LIKEQIENKGNLKSLNCESWIARILNLDDRLNWLNIIDITKESINYIIDTRSSELKRTLNCVASIFMGKTHPFIKLEEKYTLIYVFWIRAVIIEKQWSFQEREDLWGHFDKGYYLFMKSPDNSMIDKKRMKLFQG
jgi:hypothetical protein